ncbi:hypothetical protein MMC21_001733 [Puttea exsequens]|nr:hypothetical protein [Puttea exsequens]
MTGDIHIEPLNSSDRFEKSRVRWNKYGFDVGFNLILWLANDKYSSQIQDVFQQAVASKGKSWIHRQFMEIRETDTEVRWQEDITGTEGEGAGWPCKYDEWPKGAFFMTVDRRKGLRGHVIGESSLKISVQLQLCDIQTVFSDLNTDVSGLSGYPMEIWVVDTTDTGGKSLKERTCREGQQEPRESLQLLFMVLGLMGSLVALLLGYT